MAGNWLDMIQDDSHGFFSTEHGGTHNSHWYRVLEHWDRVSCAHWLYSYENKHHIFFGNK
jgi:hypothetical protein